MDSANSKEAEAISSGAVWNSLPVSNGANNQPGARHIQNQFPANTELTNFRNVDLGPGYGAGAEAAQFSGEKGSAAEGPVLPPYSKDFLAPPSYDAVGGTPFGPQPIFTQPGLHQGQSYAYHNNGGSGEGWVQGPPRKIVLFIQKFLITSRARENNDCDYLSDNHNFLASLTFT